MLEGDEDAVRALFTHIERDGRHDSVGSSSRAWWRRGCSPRWAMARMAEDGEPDIPLIAHVEGISPAAGRGTTPEQDEVLDAMRNAAGTSTRSDTHRSGRPVCRFGR